MKLYIFDLDGVVYRGAEMVRGAADTLRALTDAGHAVYYLTNNATRDRRSFMQKLAGMGIETDEAHIMTSAYATAIYLSRLQPGAQVMVVGEEGLRQEMLSAGLTLTADPKQASFVVAGLDKNFTYRKLTQAHRAILSGAVFIATNRDNTYPVEGETIPGGGAVVSAIEAASGAVPLVIGKPEAYAFDIIMSIAGIGPEATVAVGDRADTDVAGGNRVGARTVLVLSGVTSAEDAESLQGEEKPDIIIEDISVLTADM